MPELSIPESYLDRFWARVDRRRSDECWPWTGHLSPKGYGVFYFGNKRKEKLRCIRAHRASFALANPGELTTDRLVCHACDNPTCCNPGHLWLGTGNDNIQDKVAKGRQAHGDASGRTKISERDAEIILNDPRGTKELATAYGVHRTTIQRIRRGRRLAHRRSADRAFVASPSSRFPSRPKASIPLRGEGA